MIERKVNPDAHSMLKHLAGIRSPAPEEGSKEDDVDEAPDSVPKEVRINHVHSNNVQKMNRKLKEEELEKIREEEKVSGVKIGGELEGVRLPNSTIRGTRPVAGTQVPM